ncbi:hypothetical protein BDV59DRAFT_189125, partial [Aspergillus ambiguus]|uniref:uncharacterized protein n=1 Tax=Aspergillus ambiguus TaxID=176160 RepID=UPI003CCD6CA5
MVQRLNMPLNTRIRESRNQPPRGNHRVLRHRHQVAMRRYAEDQLQQSNISFTGDARIAVGNNSFRVSNRSRGNRAPGYRSRGRDSYRPGRRNDPRSLSPPLTNDALPSGREPM